MKKHHVPWILLAALAVGSLIVAQSGLGEWWATEYWVDASGDGCVGWYESGPSDDLAASLCRVSSDDALEIYSGTNGSDGNRAQVIIKTIDTSSAKQNSVEFQGGKTLFNIPAEFEGTFNALEGGTYKDGIVIDDTTNSAGGDAIQVWDSTPTKNGFWQHDGDISVVDLTATGTISGLTVDVPITLNAYLEENVRQLDQQIWGGFEQYVTADTIDPTPTNITYTHGLSKVFVVLNTCSDSSGTITITGTSVNRDTAAETGSDTDDLTISTTTTDSSTTDAQSNTIHRFTDGYLSSKWFKGSLTLSTSDVNCTDVDIYGVSFHQFNDNSTLTLDTFDASEWITNTAAWTYLYLYSVQPNGDLCDITDEATLALTVGDSEANKFYRYRKGALAVSLDGTTDGVWADLHFGPNSLTYHENVSLFLYATQTINVE